MSALLKCVAVKIVVMHSAISWDSRQEQAVILWPYGLINPHLFAHAVSQWWTAVETLIASAVWVYISGTLCCGHVCYHVTLVFFNTFLAESCGHMSCFKLKSQHCKCLAVDLVPLQFRETVWLLSTLWNGMVAQSIYMYMNIQHLFNS